jgi:hypothetical protein
LGDAKGSRSAQEVTTIMTTTIPALLASGLQEELFDAIGKFFAPAKQLHTFKMT